MYERVLRNKHIDILSLYNKRIIQLTAIFSLPHCKVELDLLIRLFNKIV